MIYNLKIVTSAYNLLCFNYQKLKFYNLLMGSSCIRILSGDNQDEVVIENTTYRDFTPKRYSSYYDHFFKSFDTKINLLKYINIIEFAFSLNRFKFEFSDLNGVSTIETKSSIFTEVINTQQLMIFIENKIIKHHMIYDLEIAQDLKEIFSEFLLKLFETIKKGYLSYVKIFNSLNQEKLDKKPKKFFFLALGILLCGGYNRSKIDIIFSTFANEVNRLERTNLKFDLFILVLFLVASYAIFKNIDDCSSFYPEAFNFRASDEEKNIVYEKFDLQRIIKLKDNFINQLFGSSQNLTYYEYREKIVHNQGEEKNSLDWFLSCSGIRGNLDDLI